MLDFNDAPGQVSPGDNWADLVNSVKLEIQTRQLEILYHLLPGGRVNGVEYEAADINGGAGKSLKFNLQKGNWTDFADADKGGDIITLWQKKKNVNFKGAITGLADFLEVKHALPPKGTSQAAKKKPQEFGAPTQIWHYLDSEDKVIAKVTRFDPPGGKEFIPFDVKTQKHTYPVPRPLYSLNLLPKRQEIVLVEGEKCADALLAAGIWATTAMGGSNTKIDKTDWEPLRGKQVLIWPDNDETGLKYAAKIKEHLAAGIAAGVSIVDIPAGKPKGWDVADAYEEGFDVNSLLNFPAPVNTPEPAPERGPSAFDLDAWGMDAYRGPAPERKWLIERIFPMAAVSILAAAGDSGKGMLSLDLGLKVAGYPGSTLNPVEAFGNRVATHGSVVILTAEDDKAEVHRRLEGIDPENKRFNLPHKLIVVPLPNAGGVFPVVENGQKGPAISQAFVTLTERLGTVPNLSLIVIDPLASFCHIDVNADPAAGAFLTGVLGELATTTGAAVLVAHHMNKKSIEGAKGGDSTRSQIRGTTALVDGVRAAFTLSTVDKQTSVKRCKTLNTPYTENKCFDGQLVKANGPGDRELKHFVRNDSGLLEVRNEDINKFDPTDEDKKVFLMADIARMAKEGKPFMITGNNGLYERKYEDLSTELKKTGRDTLKRLADELIEDELIFKTACGKSKYAKWLDIEGGPFHQGKGKFAEGFPIDKKQK